MSGRVLFVSQNEYGRAENLTALFNAYDGDKVFIHGIERMRTAAIDGYSVIVCDALPEYVENKGDCKIINICHGMTGNKVYGMDESGDWVKPAAFSQTDYAIAASKASIPIVAQQLGIPTERVKALGFPRTDIYADMHKGDGDTLLADFRSYLYAPTFRDSDKGGYLPSVDWQKLDAMLDDNELLAVKRHYFTQEPLLDSEYSHIIEIDPQEPITPYLVDCDCLITDYSSCMSDGYLLGKPCILAIDDIDEYLRDRPMYYRYPHDYSSRWLVMSGNEEYLVSFMCDAIERGLTETERKYRYKTAGACDGNSCKRICDLIRRCCNG